jgi:hypothetical protein
MVHAWSGDYSELFLICIDWNLPSFFHSFVVRLIVRIIDNKNRIDMIFSKTRMVSKILQ